MKRFINAIVILALCALPAFAAMDDVPYAVSVIASQTNSRAYVLRGTIESVYVDIVANTTNTVTITDDYGTILSKASITADTKFYPRVAGQTTGGAAFTYLITGAATDTVTSASCEKIAVAGPVTVTVIGQNASTTNITTTTIIIDK